MEVCRGPGDLASAAARCAGNIDAHHFLSGQFPSKNAIVGRGPTNLISFKAWGWEEAFREPENVGETVVLRATNDEVGLMNLSHGS